MVDRLRGRREFFAQLEQEDEKITQKVADGGCLACGSGALHRSDYSRKPRGGLIAPEGEGRVTRFQPSPRSGRGAASGRRCSAAWTWASGCTSARW